MSRRTFTPPWSVTDSGSSWCVADASGFKIVWFCYDARERKGDTAQELMTREEAYAMAVNFARLPTLLEKVRKGG